MDVARRSTFDVEPRRFGGMIAEPGVGSGGGLAVDPCPSRDDYSEQAILLGRLKAGKASESRRVVHVLPLVPGIQHHAVVRARCGAELSTCDVQWLPGLTGMPCEQCVMAG